MNRRTWLMMKEALISWLVAVVILGLLIVKGLPMVAKTIEEMYAEEEERAAVGELEDKLVKLAKIDQGNLDRGIIVLARVLPEEFNVSKSVAGLSRQADEVGLEVSEYRAVVPKTEVRSEDAGGGKLSGAKKTREKLERQKFNMTISGDWESWVEFIGKINRIAPVAKVNGFQVSVGKEADYEFDLALEGYYYPSKVEGMTEEMGGQEINFTDIGRAPVTLSQRQRGIWEEVLGMDFSVYERRQEEEIPVTEGEVGG